MKHSDVVYTHMGVIELYFDDLMAAKNKFFSKKMRKAFTKKYNEFASKITTDRKVYIKIYHFNNHRPQKGKDREFDIPRVHIPTKDVIKLNRPKAEYSNPQFNEMF